MGMMVQLSDGGTAIAEDFVGRGRFASIEDAVDAALCLLSDEAVDLDDLSPEDRAAVEEGLADIAAGRVHDAEEVFAELIARFEAMAAQR